MMRADCWHEPINTKHRGAGEADVRLVYDITTIKELETDPGGVGVGGSGGIPRVTRDLRTCLARWEIWDMIVLINNYHPGTDYLLLSWQGRIPLLPISSDTDLILRYWEDRGTARLHSGRSACQCQSDLAFLFPSYLQSYSRLEPGPAALFSSPKSERGFLSRRETELLTCSPARWEMALASSLQKYQANWPHHNGKNYISV